MALAESVAERIRAGLEATMRARNGHWPDTGIPGALTGTVQDIGWRATRLRTADRRVAIVPNSVLAQGTLINLDATTGGADVVLRFRVRATADLAQVERWCVEALKSASIRPSAIACTKPATSTSPDGAATPGRTTKATEPARR